MNMSCFGRDKTTAMVNMKMFIPQTEKRIVDTDIILAQTLEYRSNRIERLTVSGDNAVACDKRDFQSSLPDDLRQASI